MHVQNHCSFKKLSPTDLFIPIAASGFCFYLPRIIDNTFPQTYPPHPTRLSYFRSTIRCYFLDGISRRLPTVGHVLKVQVADNLYLSIFVLSLFQGLRDADSPSIFDESGKYAIIILSSCMALHLARRLTVKTVTAFSSRCLPKEFSEKINRLISKISPSG